MEKSFLFNDTIMFLLYVVFISVIAICAFPVLVLIFLSSFVVQGFPILFFQKRVGKDGKPFLMYKFRTMRVGAEKDQIRLRKQNEATGPVFKIHDDPRFTRIGKFLSHTGLDELPQLFNVLRGDMALIGPRPLPLNEARKLTKWQQRRQNIKPGIISPWILDGYHSKPFDQWMKSDIAYIQKKSVWYDVELSVQMIPYIFRLIIGELW